MASFDIAILILLKAEGDGAIARDPHDPGGLTRWGISQRSYPHLDIANLSRDDALAIYKRDWWLPAYNQINDQTTATKVFVSAVNMGTKSAHICLQRAVRGASNVILIEDGVLGFRTIAQVNACNITAMIASYKSELAGYYRMINNPAEITGWLARAYS
jgi:lysozyme family protein